MSASHYPFDKSGQGLFVLPGLSVRLRSACCEAWFLCRGGLHYECRAMEYSGKGEALVLVCDFYEVVKRCDLVKRAPCVVVPF